MRILWWLNLVSGSDCQQYRRKLQAPKLPTPSYILSVFRAPQVIFIDRALSEVSQTKLNRFWDFETGQVQAVAVGLGVIQNRARLFTSVLNWCPCREARHVQKSFSIFWSYKHNALLPERLQLICNIFKMGHG